MNSTRAAIRASIGIGTHREGQVMAEAHPGDRFGLVGRHGELILDASSARLLNEIRSEIKRLSNPAGVPPVNVSEDGSGRRIAIAITPPIEAKLSGTGAPY